MGEPQRSKKSDRAKTAPASDVDSETPVLSPAHEAKHQAGQLAGLLPDFEPSAEAESASRNMQAGQMGGLLLGARNPELPFDTSNPIVKSYGAAAQVKIAKAESDLEKARIITQDLRTRGFKHKTKGEDDGDTCGTMADLIKSHLHAFGIESARVELEKSSIKATLKYAAGHHMVVFESDGSTWAVVHGDDVYRDDIPPGGSIVVPYQEALQYWDDTADAQIEATSAEREVLLAGSSEPTPESIEEHAASVRAVFETRNRQLKVPFRNGTLMQRDAYGNRRPVIYWDSISLVEVMKSVPAQVAAKFYSVSNEFVSKRQARKIGKQQAKQVKNTADSLVGSTRNQVVAEREPGKEEMLDPLVPARDLPDFLRKRLESLVDDDEYRKRMANLLDLDAEDLPPLKGELVLAKNLVRDIIVQAATEQEGLRASNSLKHPAE